MKYTRIFLFLSILIQVILLSCEEQYNNRLVFYIQAITADREVVAPGEPVNLTADIALQGQIYRNKIKYEWSADEGTFSDAAKQVTTWTAPDNEIGDFMISLKVTYMGNTEEGDLTIKVVKSPVGEFGSLSGHILDSDRNPMENILVTTKTGEIDTTDAEGFFYFENLSQGSTGLEFSNIDYRWVTEMPDVIAVSGGSHEHLGNIIIYPSTPPLISEYEEIPERQTIIRLIHILPQLYSYYELYRSYNASGAGAELILTLDAETTEWIIEEAVDNAWFALRAIPFYGESSDLSDWTEVPFLDVIDPDAEMSWFEYNSFYSATLHWVSPGYEEYLKGFRIARDNGTAYDFVTPLLSVDTEEFDVETRPGETGLYYVISYNLSGIYNETQPSSRQISLEVPEMEMPEGFDGRLVYGTDTTVRLQWEPIAANNTWYSGYQIHKKVDSDTGWQELARIGDSFTGEYTDAAVDSGYTYKYSIRSVSYPEGLGNPEYSAADSITLDFIIF